MSVEDPFPWGLSDWDAYRTIDVHLGVRLRIRGATPPLHLRLYGVVLNKQQGQYHFNLYTKRRITDSCNLFCINYIVQGSRTYRDYVLLVMTPCSFVCKLKAFGGDFCFRVQNITNLLIYAALCPLSPLLLTEITFYLTEQIYRFGSCVV